MAKQKFKMRKTKQRPPADQVRMADVQVQKDPGLKPYLALNRVRPEPDDPFPSMRHFAKDLKETTISDLYRTPPENVLHATRTAKAHAGTWGKIEDYPPHLSDQDEQEISNKLRERGLVMEKPQGSSLHHAIEALRGRGMPKVAQDFLQDHFQSFVVEHDWAKAFGNTDMSGGDVRLPYEFTAFEFRITGQRIIVCIGEAEARDGGPKKSLGLLLTGINNRWYIPSDLLQFEDGRLIDKSASEDLSTYQYGVEFLDLLSRQIRAVCIMLDAEVAETTVVRVSEKLARNRAKLGKLPMKDYHVVSLAKRHKVSRPESQLISGRSSPRCHMRRGHWRHFENHRVWIKWQMIGDPDLGFIDKHYKL